MAISSAHCFSIAEILDMMEPGFMAWASAVFCNQANLLSLVLQSGKNLLSPLA